MTERTAGDDETVALLKAGGRQTTQSGRMTEKANVCQRFDHRLGGALSVQLLRNPSTEQPRFFLINWKFFLAFI